MPFLFVGLATPQYGKMLRMNSNRTHVLAKILTRCVAIAFVAAATAFALRGRSALAEHRPVAAQAQSQDQEIPASQTIPPEDLVKELTGNAKPIVVCVAPHFLYQGAHIPGALFHGPGSIPDGLKDLRQWAQGTPRDANIVIYCGCCPLTRCPNVRPALHALTEMGFSHVKVLWLQKDFHTDWIEKGYPVEKGL